MIIILVILMRFEMRIKSSEMNFFVFYYRVMVTCQNSLRKHDKTLHLPEYLMYDKGRLVIQTM